MVNVAERFASVRSAAARSAVRVRDLIPDRAVDLVREIRDDRVTSVAAEVAFFTILSIVPWLVMVAAAVGSLDALLGVDVADDVKAFVLEWMQRMLTERAGQAVAAVRALFEQERQGVLTIGGLVAVWSSSRGFAAVIASLNVAYDVEETRSWIARRGRAMILAVGSIAVATLLLVAFVAEPLIRALGLFGAGALVAEGWAWMRWPASVVVLVAWAALLFRVAPNRYVPWKDTLPGAVTAAGSWIAASIGFRVYLDVAGNANPIFGVLGGSLILLVWLYLLAFGLLVGGELNAIVAGKRK